MMMHDDQQRDKYEYMANGIMMKRINFLVVVIIYTSVSVSVKVSVKASACFLLNLYRSNGQIN
jgi:hypothetical protein